MDTLRTIKNQNGIAIKLCDIHFGKISSSQDLDDYGIYVDKDPVEVHYDNEIGGYFFGHNGAGQTILNNFELRDEVLPLLTITI